MSDRICCRGYFIEAAPSFNLEAAAWKAKVFIWTPAGETIGHFVDDYTGATFSTYKHAVHASLFLARRWAAQQP